MASFLTTEERLGSQTATIPIPTRRSNLQPKQHVLSVECTVEAKELGDIKLEDLTEGVHRNMLSMQ
jgi:hypothetical protein